MPTMTGRIVFSAVTCGLLVSLCACSPAQDVEALRPATEQGDAEAQYSFALMYRDGEGVPQDAAEAVRWYRRAADQGHARAQHDLALMYLEGEGVPRDDTEAARWFRLAADQGLADAQVNLGFMYGTGRGVPQDETEALRWFRLAADQDSRTRSTTSGPCMGSAGASRRMRRRLFGGSGSPPTRGSPQRSTTLG